MERKPIQVFHHRLWAPADVERLSGITPVALRDLRRRGLAPDREDGKLSLEAATQLLLQSELVAHGFGPKRVNALAQKHSGALKKHALHERDAWSDQASHNVWLADDSNNPQTRYLLIGKNMEATPIQDLSELSAKSETVVTVVDLKSLGQKLSRHLRERPSSTSILGKRRTKK